MKIEPPKSVATAYRRLAISIIRLLILQQIDAPPRLQEKEKQLMQEKEKSIIELDEEIIPEKIKKAVEEGLIVRTLAEWGTPSCYNCLYYFDRDKNLSCPIDFGSSPFDLCKICLLKELCSEPCKSLMFATREGSHKYLLPTFTENADEKCPYYLYSEPLLVDFQEQIQYLLQKTKELYNIDREKIFSAIQQIIQNFLERVKLNKAIWQ